MNSESLTVTAIPAFADNYIWLIRGSGRECAVVDPGDHRPVLKVLQQSGLVLTHILLTHHHADHIGGVAGLLEKFPATVTGPADTRIANLTRVVAEGEVVELKKPGLKLAVLEVPGHTSSHIAFHGHGLLFCGDTLFSVGCGRLLEGSAEQMQTSMDKLAALPPATRVYCAHEYTQSNCRFALEVEPLNEELLERSRQVDELRSQGQISIPSTLAEELSVNPFLRTRQQAVLAAARKIDPQAQPGTHTMAVIRAWKDRF